MTLLHFHLLLNHVPVICPLFLVFVFGFAVVKRDSSLSKVGLKLCVVLAAITGAVYLTGGAAEQLAENITGVSELSISLHEEAAEISTIAFTLFGILSLASLIVYRRKPIPRRASIAALGATIVISGMMAWTANLGGNIRHTELQTVPVTASAEQQD